MTDTASAPIRLPIGTLDGVAFDVVAWGPAHADVDFSVACMFEHELGGAMGGGLLALDQALGGQLARLRAAGAFRAQPMETLLVTTPPPGVTPRAVLVIGMGDPAALDGDLLRRACRVAMREAIRHGATSMAFAPSVLDAGHTDNAALDMQEVMLDGMLGALRAEHVLADAGLAGTPALRHCTFDVGAPRAQAAGRAFAAAFARATAATRQ
ncbi:M17 family peptidase N-terminal domain-containing protein [Massilia luteola]|uniref:M17 family peptidase N-terminal domain-containing protein n=1 Tax=Massilia luteola TaxID=3081751 RepID=UPI002ACC284C|nr:M17 family peptidase N-terminal domain-containing protein [Massilia sp. Gc5]